MLVFKASKRTIGFDKWVKNNITDLCTDAIDPENPTLIGKYNGIPVALWQTDIHEITLAPRNANDAIRCVAGQMITIKI